MRHTKGWKRRGASPTRPRGVHRAFERCDDCDFCKDGRKGGGAKCTWCGGSRQ